MANRRSFRNRFARPSRQLFLFLTIFILATFAVCIKIVTMLFGLREQVSLLSNRYQLPPELQDSLSKSITSTAVVMIVAGLAMTLAALSISATLSQRIFAPMVSIKRLLAKLHEGNYAARGNLRKGDEFKDVMDQINSLAQRLEERHGPTPRS